jgi:elongation factor 1-alpha
MLLDTGHIEQHIIDKYRKEAESKGKGSFEFAWVMDGLKEERERGLTIDVAHKRFDTKNYYFTIIDAPGHRDFVKNMITGTSQADAAVLVVAAPEGVMAQTKEHVFLSKTLGVNQLVIAINKMDATQPEYSEERFNEVKEEVTKLMGTVGYKKEQVTFVPVSAFKGDNATKASDKLKWYKGPTILEAINNFKLMDKPVELPLRWPIQDVYTITGIGTVPVGRVETGVLKIGQNLIFHPSNKTGEVKSIEMHHEEIGEAKPGDNVGVNIRGLSKTDIRRGDVAGVTDNPPTVVKSFTAQLAVLQHPSVIAPGYTPVFHCHTSQVACTFVELQKKLDPKTGQVKEENPQFLKTGDIAIVKIQPTRPIVLERAKDFPQLGRFAVRDMGQTVAAGMVVEVEKKEM